MNDLVFSGGEDELSWSDGDLTFTILWQDWHWVLESIYGEDGKITEK